MVETNNSFLFGLPQTHLAIWTISTMTTRDPGCGGALCALARKFCSFLPRRVAEPTGPLDVILDILLGLVVAKGASRAQLAQLPSEVISRERATCGDRCAICLGAFEHGDVTRVLACSHRFHAEVSCFPIPLSPTNQIFSVSIVGL